tara:strand:- start:216 stop:3068 length:2853 start_codon:yes stop_codon:yes gene_type:complete
MDPITQKLLMASAGSGDAAAPYVEDVFSMDPYFGYGGGYDSPFPSGFNTNYGKDGYYSTYFPGDSGNSSYITGDADPGANPGSVDFCVEMWIKCPPLGTGTDGNKYHTLWQLDWNSGTGANNLAIQLQFNGSSGMNVRAGNGNWDTGIGNTDAVDDRQWHHIALVRSFNTSPAYMRIYVDGVQSVNNTGSIATADFSPSGGSRFRWGSWDNSNGRYKGYISNFRYTYGAVVYSAPFTPPTAPLTGGTLRCLQGAKPYLNSLPRDQSWRMTINSDYTVNTPSLLGEDIDWTDGGMVWIKKKEGNGSHHNLFDTERGATKVLYTSHPNQEDTKVGGVSAFTSKGINFVNGADPNHQMEDSCTYRALEYMSWGFKKTPRFFDMVKWNGNDTSGRQLNHTLSCEPGMILVKRTDANGDWVIYHRGVGYDGNPPENYKLGFNQDTRNTSFSDGWAQTAPTEHKFTIGSDANINATGGSYIAYLFAHDDESEGVIKCGNYTGNGGTNKVTLGWEPQYVMLKRTDGSSHWLILDSARSNLRTYARGNDGASTETNVGRVLKADSDVVENSSQDITADATGFWLPPTNADLNATGSQWVYMAIRRGPMQPITDAKKVFATSKGWANKPAFYSGFEPDAVWHKDASSSNQGTAGWWYVTTRKIGQQPPNANFGGGLVKWTMPEPHAFMSSEMDYGKDNKGFYHGGNATESRHSLLFKRAPQFFDTVGYVGNNTNYNPGYERAIPHSLGVKPELIITRYFGSSTSASPQATIVNNCGNLPATAAPPYDGVDEKGWKMICDDAGHSPVYTWQNESSGHTPATYMWGSSSDTNTHFYVGGSPGTNKTDHSYMAWLWATCPKVSKVGYYVGTGTDLDIECDFDGEARFVMINKWNNGNWYLFDSKLGSGITGGNTSFLDWGFSTSQNNSNDYIDPYTGGFTVNHFANTTINVTGHYYTFIAIA